MGNSILMELLTLPLHKPRIFFIAQPEAKLDLLPFEPWSTLFKEFPEFLNKNSKAGSRICLYFSWLSWLECPVPPNPSQNLLSFLCCASLNAFSTPV